MRSPEAGLERGREELVRQRSVLVQEKEHRSFVEIVVAEIDLVFGSPLAGGQLSNHPEGFFLFRSRRMRRAGQRDAVAVIVQPNVVLEEGVVRVEDVIV